MEMSMNSLLFSMKIEDQAGKYVFFKGRPLNKFTLCICIN